ncbi:MAG: DNRLRE domain-containing protein [Gemmatimonadaceae bacterium]|nr:DNRLRE domain-containing protein [Gemmatimonadaceae bacterium]
MRVVRATARVAAVVIAGAMLATCSDVNTPTRVNQRVPASPRLDVVPGVDPVVVAVGDAVCGTGSSASSPCKDEEVAARISALTPHAVLLLGDLQYENGTLADFNTYYNASYGAFKSISYPAAGNHEYNTANASGYYDYFNGVGVQAGPAGDRSKGYYSFNLGSWHLVALNSNCSAIGGCGAGSAQEQWLRADLAANTASCTLAYWHHPLFSSGSHGNNTIVQPLYQALYDYGAELVLSGHDHTYERFAPQTAAGVLDNARGIREFVVGTGGKEQTAFSTVRANSVVRSNSSFGALKLTLKAAGYDWQFVSIPGNTLADAGSGTCSAPLPPPPAQTTLTIPVSADAYTFKNSPNTNYGTQTTLLVDGSPVARTYFKFAVTGIGAKSVVSAKLRLYAVDPSDTGGRLHRVAGTTWGETSIKWSNAPAYDAAIVGTLGAVVVGAWYEVDVKGYVTADGTVSFALESTSTNGADYRSREGGSGTAPRLVIVTQ